MQYVLLLEFIATWFFLLSSPALGGFNRSMQSLPPPRDMTFERPTRKAPPTTTTPSTTSKTLPPEPDPITPVPSIEIVASLPKLSVDKVRPSCLAVANANVTNQRKVGLTGGGTGGGTTHPRVASRLIVLKPGKNIHCSKTRQETSGLDCPCAVPGARCAPANSVCSLFAADLATCGCNMGTSFRKGARCEVNNTNTISARGIGFRLFSPAPVLEVSCRLPPCFPFATLNILMGVSPFEWTVRRLYTTNNFANLTGAQVGSSSEPIDLELDNITAAIHIKSVGGTPACANATNDSTSIWSFSGAPNARSTPVPRWTVPFVQLYTVTAKGSDAVSSNTLTLTVFFLNDC
ncbi:hypothetical protein BV898_13842 [Hypsibius exemplaris]|uniref:EGF-like domain-containing protein n=1 Tax=Hypsibius exemplaris TaxID=2072580 RepID=A0A1W0W9J9_HYPEX|nr:hypothetical protein BV898_13842 [Hypsibius exemplaris]